MGQKRLGRVWGIGDAKGLDQVLEVALMGVKYHFPLSPPLVSEPGDRRYGDPVL